MTFVVLFILAVVWAVYLVSWARSRSEHRSVNSISTFNKHLSVLERTTPGRSNAPTRLAGSPAPQRSGSLARPAYAPNGHRVGGSVALSRRQARERRKNILFGLGGAVMLTLALAVILGGPFIYLQLLADVLLVAYVVALVQMRRLAEERQAKVRYLQQPIDLRDGHDPYGGYAEPSSGLVLQSSAR